MRLASALLLLTIAQAASAAELVSEPPLVGNWPADRVTCRPVSLRRVQLDGFLGEHVRANADSLMAGLESPFPAAFDALAAGRPIPESAKRLAADSDFYKWLEAACHVLASEEARSERADSRAAIDRHAAILVNSQESSGYLGTRTSPAGPFDQKVRHDLYVAGHFIEAGHGKRDRFARSGNFDHIFPEILTTSTLDARGRWPRGIYRFDANSEG